MYSFTNRFSGPSLRQRIGMINGRRSGALAWWRYVAWVLLMGGMAFACRHKNVDYEGTVHKLSNAPFPTSNATRVLAAELEMAANVWFRQSTLLPLDKNIVIKDRQVSIRPVSSYPEILSLRNNHLALKLPDGKRANVFINGQPSTATALSELTFEQVEDLFVYQKWDDATGADKFPEMYRVFISTTHKTPKLNRLRENWKQYLLANAVSDYPLGKSSAFSMNTLLEATFFNNKLTFVKRTKKDYLQLYDEYASDIDLYINGLPVTSKDIESVHVREVDKLYTRERPFGEWTDGPNQQHRFTLFIQTAPKRANRDSTYYVFSPFYSGDF